MSTAMPVTSRDPGPQYERRELGRVGLIAGLVALFMIPGNVLFLLWPIELEGSSAAFDAVYRAGHATGLAIGLLALALVPRSIVNVRLADRSLTTQGLLGTMRVRISLSEITDVRALSVPWATNVGQIYFMGSGRIYSAAVFPATMAEIATGDGSKVRIEDDAGELMAALAGACPNLSELAPGHLGVRAPARRRPAPEWQPAFSAHPFQERTIDWAGFGLAFASLMLFAVLPAVFLADRLGGVVVLYAAVAGTGVVGITVYRAFFTLRVGDGEVLFHEALGFRETRILLGAIEDARIVRRRWYGNALADKDHRLVYPKQTIATDAVEITVNDGRRYLLGTREPEALLAALGWEENPD